MMTGDSIKNESHDHPKGKHDRKYAVSKRRSSRNSQVCEGGAIAADMTLSVQENAKLSKQLDLNRIPELQAQKTGEIPTPEGKSGCEEPKLAKEDSQETRHLKELLLLHLDLIQHQHELLTAKEKQLQAVKKDRDALKCRLERMERRMSLLKQKKEAASPRFESESSSTTGSPARQNRRDGENRGIKRRHPLEPQSLSKRFAAASKGESPHKHRQASTLSQRQLSRLEASKARETRLPAPAYLDPKNIPKRPCDRYFESPDNKVEVVDTQKLLRLAQKRSQQIMKKHKNIHRTPLMYYIPPFVPEVCELSPPKKRKDCVAVPTWRIKQIPKAYTLEGTENLGDDIYIKRHQKPENDEKRRKRWDMQQLREQTMVEKLRQSKAQTKGSRGPNIMQVKETEPEQQSLLPTLDDIKFIEVCDSIPISAFGDTLPNLQPKSFDLPWFDPEKRRKEERSKSRCRKR